MLIEKTHRTSYGTIHYWVNHIPSSEPVLVFLPGLSADHRLFDKQIAFVKERYRLLVWDTPGHGASRPFSLSFDLFDLAYWLHEIMVAEGFLSPVLVGQSMGGHIAQAYAQAYADSLAGLVAIDTTPLQKKYYRISDLWFLKYGTYLYQIYPWRRFQVYVPETLALTSYGRSLMEEMLRSYDDNPKEYTRLVRHGFRIIAQAIEEDRPYRLSCPVLLLCGEQDYAVNVAVLNERWHAMESYPLIWLRGAGHNANTDAPEKVNDLIETFLVHTIKLDG